MVTGFLDAILKVFPIIALIILGFLLQKINFFQQNGTGNIKKIVTNIALPSLLYSAFYRLELDVKLLMIVATVFTTCVLMVLIGKLLTRLMSIKSRYFALLFGGFETGMLGYAIFSVAYGADNVQKLAIVDLGQVLFVFFILMALITRLSAGFQGPVQQIRTFATSPVIIAIILGIITSIVNGFSGFTNNHLFLSFFQFIVLLGSMTVPLICIVIGYELKISSKSIILPLKTIIIRMFLLLGLALLINELLFTKLLGLESMFRYALITMFILPPPFVIPIFMKDEDVEEKQYVLNCLSLGTVLSLIVLVLVMMFYR